MTVTEAINAVNILRKDNNCSEEQKLQWLSDADTRNNEILGFYTQLSPRREYDLWYSAENEDVTELIAQGEYAQMYIHYLCAKIDFLNSDIQKYNNETMLYERYFDDWCAWLNRTYTHKKDTLQITGWL